MSEIKATILIEFWSQNCQYQYRYQRDASSADYVNMIHTADHIKDCTVDCIQSTVRSRDGLLTRDWLLPVWDTQVKFNRTYFRIWEVSTRSMQR